MDKKNNCLTTVLVRHAHCLLNAASDVCIELGGARRGSLERQKEFQCPKVCPSFGPSGVVRCVEQKADGREEEERGDQWTAYYKFWTHSCVNVGLGRTVPLRGG